MTDEEHISYMEKGFVEAAFSVNALKAKGRVFTPAEEEFYKAAYTAGFARARAILDYMGLVK